VEQQKSWKDGKIEMERGTKLALALGATLLISGLVFVGIGDFGLWISQFPGLGSGHSAAASIQDTGYVLVGIPIAAFIIIVAIVVARGLRGNSSGYMGWSG
jgi:hypothetical protein